MTFHGKTAAITGAGSGIGRALAIRLAKEGTNVAISDVDVAGLAETEALLNSYNVDVSSSKLDVRDKDAVDQWAKSLQDEFGSVDYIFNNAGVALSSYAAEQSYEDFNWMMSINFWGVIHGCTAFLPHMIEQDKGHVINISSVFGLIGVPTQSAYNAAKFAVKGYTEALALEMQDCNVGVSCVHPGGIATEIARNAKNRIFKAGSKEEKAQHDHFDTLAITTADEAARVILEGVDKNKRRILIGRDAKILDIIQRVFPSSYSKVLNFLNTGFHKKSD